MEVMTHTGSVRRPGYQNEMMKIMNLPGMEHAVIHGMPDIHKNVNGDTICLTGFTVRAFERVVPFRKEDCYGDGLLAVNFADVIQRKAFVQSVGKALAANDCEECGPNESPYFVDLARDQDGHHWILNQMGEGPVANQIAGSYAKNAVDGCLTGDDTVAYLKDLMWVDEIADKNRTQLLSDIKRQLKKYYTESECTTRKNSLDLSDPANPILRFGAADASKGNRLVLSLYEKLGYIVGIGRGNAGWNQSAPLYVGNTTLDTLLPTIQIINFLTPVSHISFKRK